MTDRTSSLPQWTPNPISIRDARCILGIVACLQGDVYARGEIVGLAQNAYEWISQNGGDTLPEDAGPNEFMNLLQDINVHLRFALGERTEYDDPEHHGPRIDPSE